MHRRSTRAVLLSFLTEDRKSRSILPLLREWESQADTLATRTQRLVTAAEELRRSPAAGTVRECQLAWEAARLPWERTEGFLVGKLRDEGWGERIDGWPILPGEVEAELLDYAAQRSLRTRKSDCASAGPRGFHVLELLLYTVDGRGPATVETIASHLAAEPDRLLFLNAMAASLCADCRQFRQAAGSTSGGLAPDSLLAPLLLERWAELLEEACFAKVLLPVQRGDPSLLESRWSQSTHRDVEANLEGMARAGRLLLPAVAGRDHPELVERWEAGMASCLRMVRSLPELSEVALHRALPAAESLFAAGHHLSQLISAELLPRARGAT